MKFKNPLLAVADMERSKAFYNEVLGLRVVADFGANVTLTGGVCLQTLESGRQFIGAEQVGKPGACGELYFEEQEFEAFLRRVQAMPQVRWVHAPYTHRWGQRVARIFDPDGHILEVGEPLEAVARRFAAQGMTAGQVAERMGVPEAMVRRWLK